MEHKIAVKNYEYECGDGCCSEFGREWYVDGELVYRGSCEDDGLMHVIRKLGINAKLVGLDEQGEEAWEL